MTSKIISLYYQGLYIWETAEALDKPEAFIIKMLEYNHII